MDKKINIVLDAKDTKTLSNSKKTQVKKESSSLFDQLLANTKKTVSSSKNLEKKSFSSTLADKKTIVHSSESKEHLKINNIKTSKTSSLLDKLILDTKNKMNKKEITSDVKKEIIIDNKKETINTKDKIIGSSKNENIENTKTKDNFLSDKLSNKNHEKKVLIKKEFLLDEKKETSTSEKNEKPNLGKTEKLNSKNNKISLNKNENVDLTKTKEKKSEKILDKNVLKNIKPEINTDNEQIKNIKIISSTVETPAVELHINDKDKNKDNNKFDKNNLKKINNSKNVLDNDKNKSINNENKIEKISIKVDVQEDIKISSLVKSSSDKVDLIKNKIKNPEIKNVDILKNIEVTSLNIQKDDKTADINQKKEIINIKPLSLFEKLQMNITDNTEKSNDKIKNSSNISDLKIENTTNNKIVEKDINNKSEFKQDNQVTNKKPSKSYENTNNNVKKEMMVEKNNTKQENNINVKKDDLLNNTIDNNDILNLNKKEKLFSNMYLSSQQRVAQKQELQNTSEIKNNIANSKNIKEVKEVAKDFNLDIKESKIEIIKEQKKEISKELILDKLAFSKNILKSNLENILGTVDANVIKNELTELPDVNVKVNDLSVNTLQSRIIGARQNINSLLSDVAKKMYENYKPPVTAFRITLNPSTLGSISILMKNDKENGLSISLNMSNQATLDTMNENQGSLRTALSKNFEEASSFSLDFNMQDKEGNSSSNNKDENKNKSSTNDILNSLNSNSLDDDLDDDKNYM